MLRSLTDFLAGLPGVAPNKARAVILDGRSLPASARADIHYRDASFIDTVLLVGPDAAGAILAAYRKGRLPMKRGARPSDAPAAEAYLAKADELRHEIAERARRKRAIKDPSLIVESDLDDMRLIDRVFFANVGEGPGTMTLAGIEVRKTVGGYKSNSGKSTGWAVRFDWTGSDGKARSTDRTPPEAGNRRNDPDRNWGLPE